jgi:hypothetical protein
MTKFLIRLENATTMHGVDRKLLTDSFTFVVKMCLIAHQDLDAGRQERRVGGNRQPVIRSSRLRRMRRS